ncbi:hypothetical protein CRG98_000957 [Punica granatum]|uniref:Uncharacterized protein n=1 Tax=Punica granatum TaxID=22663 RepID=A0A2I0LD28_PUNGR|nr:hypothetical protein CRG98_000957 [Punica granatum]
MDTKSWTRSPKSSKDGREVRKAIKMDTKPWTRSPKSSKDGREVRKAAWLALPSGWLCFAGDPLFPSGGCVFDSLEADPAVGSIVCYSCWQLVSPLKRLLAGNAPVSPLRLLLARRLLVALPDRSLSMRDSSSGSTYVPSWTRDQSLP